MTFFWKQWKTFFLIYIYNPENQKRKQERNHGSQRIIQTEKWHEKKSELFEQEVIWYQKFLQEESDSFPKLCDSECLVGCNKDGCISPSFNNNKVNERFKEKDKFCKNGRVQTRTFVLGNWWSERKDPFGIESQYIEHKLGA